MLLLGPIFSRADWAGWGCYHAMACPPPGVVHGVKPLNNVKRRAIVLLWFTPTLITQIGCVKTMASLYIYIYVYNYVLYIYTQYISI